MKLIGMGPRKGQYSLILNGTGSGKVVVVSSDCDEEICFVVYDWKKDPGVN